MRRPSAIAAVASSSSCGAAGEEFRGEIWLSAAGCGSLDGARRAEDGFSNASALPVGTRDTSLDFDRQFPELCTGC